MLKSQRIASERAQVQNKLNSDRYIEMRTDDSDYKAKLGEHKELRDKLTELNNVSRLQRPCELVPKLEPRWDVNLGCARNRAESLAGLLRPFVRPTESGIPTL